MNSKNLRAYYPDLTNVLKKSGEDFALVILELLRVAYAVVPGSCCCPGSVDAIRTEYRRLRRRPRLIGQRRRSVPGPAAAAVAW
jgi:hypothetical protein